jgi:HupE / UreJ protein
MPLLRNWKRTGLILMALLIVTLPSTTVAHEIPADVMINVFLKPEGQRLRMIVRVPLAALRDTEYPRRGPESYVDLAQIDYPLRNGAQLWLTGNIELYEDGRRLTDPQIPDVRASIMADRSMASYDEALAHVTGPPLPAETNLVWNQGYMDVLYEYPIHSDRSNFSINPVLARLGLRTITIVRFLDPDGSIRAFEFRGDPGLIHLDPNWIQAALLFVRLGFVHLLDGTDYLLFLLCLVIPLRRFRQLVLVVASFTVAHSITLIASAYNMAPGAQWFTPLIQTLIAVSIVVVALENIVGNAAHRRWMIAFGSGLVYGFGFSFALRDTLQFAGSHILTSVLSFNAGVELGQLLVLLFLVPAVHFLLHHVVEERMGKIILSAIAAHTGWHWMIDRFTMLRQFQFEWPTLTAALVATLLRWVMVFVAVGGAMWLISLNARWTYRRRL